VAEWGLFAVSTLARTKEEFQCSSCRSAALRRDWRRGASKTAFPRGAWERGLPESPATDWDCRPGDPTTVSLFSLTFSRVVV
jgi:hypothetical protein